jgi:hypothetical protein
MTHSTFELLLSKLETFLRVCNLWLCSNELLITFIGGVAGLWAKSILEVWQDLELIESFCSQCVNDSGL